ncbi:MAG TPA: type II toxin-antitoxin system VapC family toxin [Longimicrobium sp.]
MYIETSIVSYLVARPSRDPMMAERQRQTRDWWDNHRGEYRLVTSEIVTREAARGEAMMAQARMNILHALPTLAVHKEADDLTRSLLARGPLPSKAETDAYHISLAAVNGLDYLLTWNCRHIANPRMYSTIAKVIQNHGFRLPALCTPDDLLRR